MARTAIGIDLGGTFIKTGAVDEAGRILSRVKIPTRVPEGREAIIGGIASAADEARRQAGLSWRDVQAVGLGAPGVFAPPRGIVHNSPNLPSLEGRELARPVSFRTSYCRFGGTPHPTTCSPAR